MNRTEIRRQLASAGHCEHEWLNKYMRFIWEPPEPASYHRHHILPKSIFPDYESFEEHPWNRKWLSASGHLTAHYLLFRALPKEPHLYRAFVEMNAKALAGSDQDVRELAATFQKDVCDSGLMLHWKRKQISDDDVPF